MRVITALTCLLAGGYFFAAKHGEQQLAQEKTSLKKSLPPVSAENGAPNEELFVVEQEEIVPDNQTVNDPFGADNQSDTADNNEMFGINGWPDEQSQGNSQGTEIEDLKDLLDKEEPF